jgi:hypothetical protein
MNMLASNVIEKNLADLGVLDMDSSTGTVQFVRNMIQNAPRPLDLANRILKNFEVSETDDVVSGIIRAQSVILKAKEAVLNKRDISSEELNEHANKQVAQMQTMGLVSNVGRKASRTNGEKKGSKRLLATELYLANKDKPLKDLAEIIATEMNVSMANARTYIYNVKKALGKK